MAKRTKKLLQIDETLPAEGEGIRLNRYLSDSGACSRREADRLIQEGHITVDGVRAELGMKVTENQTILLDGLPVKRESKLIFIALNKPRGIVCTTDRREKDNIIDFLKFDKRIYPIGRLDKDSEGLILLTNDGSIVNKILRAGNYHEKEYVVTVDKPITADFLEKMSEGVPILDTVTRPCKIKGLDKYTFQIILTQGLNRQIRRMCEYFGYKVLTLKRIRIMNIQLGHMQTGGYRNVTDKEITVLTGAIKDSVNEAVVDVKHTENIQDRKDIKAKKDIDVKRDMNIKKDTNVKRGIDAKRGMNAKRDSNAKRGMNVKRDSNAKRDIDFKRDMNAKRDSNIKRDIDFKRDMNAKRDSNIKRDIDVKRDMNAKRDNNAKRDIDVKRGMNAKRDSNAKKDIDVKRDINTKRGFSAKRDSNGEKDINAKRDINTKNDFSAKRAFSHKENTAAKGKMQGRSRKK